MTTITNKDTMNYLTNEEVFSITAKNFSDIDFANAIIAANNAKVLKDLKPCGYLCEWRGSSEYGNSQEIYCGEPGSETCDDWNRLPDVHHNLPLYSADQVAAIIAAIMRGAGFF